MRGGPCTASVGHVNAVLGNYFCGLESVPCMCTHMLSSTWKDKLQLVLLLKRMSASSHRRSLWQVFGGDKSKTRRVASLQSDVAALEAALESARAEYDRVLERNLQARSQLRPFVQHLDAVGWLRGGRSLMEQWRTSLACQ